MVEDPSKKQPEVDSLAQETERQQKALEASTQITVGGGVSEEQNSFIVTSFGDGTKADIHQVLSSPSAEGGQSHQIRIGSEPTPDAGHEKGQEVVSTDTASPVQLPVLTHNVLEGETVGGPEVKAKESGPDFIDAEFTVLGGTADDHVTQEPAREEHISWPRRFGRSVGRFWKSGLWSYASWGGHHPNLGGSLPSFAAKKVGRFWEGPVASKVSTTGRGGTGAVIGWQAAKGIVNASILTHGLVGPTAATVCSPLIVPAWYGARRFPLLWRRGSVNRGYNAGVQSFLDRQPATLNIVDTGLTDALHHSLSHLSPEHVRLLHALAQAGPTLGETPVLTEHLYSRDCLRNLFALCQLAANPQAQVGGFEPLECQELAKRLRRLEQDGPERRLLEQIGRMQNEERKYSLKLLCEASAEYARMTANAHRNDTAVNWIGGVSAAKTGVSILTLGGSNVIAAVPGLAFLGYYFSRRVYRKAKERPLSIVVRKDGRGVELRTKRGAPPPPSESFGYKSTLHQPDLLVRYRETSDVPDEKQHRRVADLVNTIVYPSALDTCTFTSAEDLSEEWSRHVQHQLTRVNKPAPEPSKTHIREAEDRRDRIHEEKLQIGQALRTAQELLGKMKMRGTNPQAEEGQQNQVNVLAAEEVEANLALQEAKRAVENAKEPEGTNERYTGDEVGNNRDMCIAFAIAVNQRWKKIEEKGGGGVKGLKSVGVTLQKSELAKAGLTVGLPALGGYYGASAIAAAKIPVVSAALGLVPAAWVPFIVASAGGYVGWQFYKGYRNYFSKKT